MPRLTLRFVAATLTFIVGIVLTSLWLFGRLPSIRRTELTASQPINQAVSFRVTLERHGSNSHYYDYEAGDGVKLMRASMRLESPERANTELWHKIELYASITEILERGPKVNSDGRTIGERLVTMQTGTESGQIAWVIWTDGAELCWIESPSLRHVLELERQVGF